MEHEEILAELLKEVLKSLPEGCLFYMDRGLDDLYNEGRLQDIVKYIVQVREWGNEGLELELANDRDIYLSLVSKGNI